MGLPASDDEGTLGPAIDEEVADIDAAGRIDI